MVLEFLGTLVEDDLVCISVVTLFEMEYSLSNCKNVNKQKIIRATIYDIQENFVVIPLEKRESGIYGDIKTKYKEEFGTSRENMKKHNIDFMIASTSISHDCTLCGLDTIYKKLSDITELKVCAWQA